METRAVTSRKAPVILTPDQRLRVFVSSTLQELAEERLAAKEAITSLCLAPVLFELGARPHPPRHLYRAYLEQSDVFVGIYWQRYGWVAPGEIMSGLEDEYLLSGEKPKLIYIKMPAPEREPGLKALLERIQDDDCASYKYFSSADELKELLGNDLALVLSERFEMTQLSELVIPEPRSNLPTPPTPLVGREREVASVKDLLLDEGVRLLTLYGTGGIGKSRLALELAHAVQEHFADGVYFVSLAAIREAKLVLDTIAQALGLKVAGPSALEGLKAFLRDKHLLLVLDNFEQVIAAAPAISELLMTAPRLKVMVTSREMLHLSGEHIYPVPPLSLFNDRAFALIDAVNESEAVQLFVTRAQAVKRDFALTADNALVIAEICHRLEGLPLAIELAAARIKLLSPQALLNRLEHRLEFLKGGARDLPSRQQTLKNTIDWSYQLLTETEQALFIRLGVFVGGSSLEAIEVLCQEACGDVVEGLTSLLDKSLINEQETEDEPRFFMLETLREYALEKLEESGQGETLRRLHADYFRDYAEEQCPHLRGPEQQTLLRRLERDHNNIRAVMSWALERGELEHIARISWALWVVWWVNAHISEGHRWLQEALAIRRQRPLSLKKEYQVKLLTVAAIMALWQGALELLFPLLDEALSLCQELGDKQVEAYALLALGTAATSQGELDRGHEALEKSVALFHAVNDTWGSFNATNALGRNIARQGKYEQASAVLEEILRLTRQGGDPLSLALVLNTLAAITLRQNDTARAEPLLNESLTMSQQVGYLEGIAWSLEGQAVAAALQQQPTRSVRLMAASEVLREIIQFPAWFDTTSYMEELKQSLRAALGEEMFVAAWAEGRTMRLEEAVSYALSDATTA
jgi:predicted ATPase